MVPEASAPAIDLLSPNFSVTYALLNSHYCAHWSLIGENNRLVVTEGKKYERAVTVSANSWLQVTEPSQWPLYSHRLVWNCQNAKLNLHRLQMNQKIGSCLFHKNKSPPHHHKTEGRLRSHKTVSMICLQLWWVPVPARPLSCSSIL